MNIGVFSQAHLLEQQQAQLTLELTRVGTDAAGSAQIETRLSPHNNLRNARITCPSTLLLLLRAT
jgi:hypothetical protein